MTSSITVSGKLEKLADVNLWLDTFATETNISKSSLYAMKLCCEETYMNIVMHSYAPENTNLTLDEQVVNLQVEYKEDDLRLIIEDNGNPFNPLEKSSSAPAKSLLDSQIGGLGISLMRKFSKAINYEPKDSGNRLIFQFETS